MSDEIGIPFKKRIVFAGRFCIRQSVDDSWHICGYLDEVFDDLEEAQEFLFDVLESEDSL